MHTIGSQSSALMYYFHTSGFHVVVPGPEGQMQTKRKLRLTWDRNHKLEGGAQYSVF